MKSYLKLFVAVFFILAAVRTVKSDYYTVSGTVRYSDNNERVTSGTVKIYDAQTCELVGQGNINSNGDYLLGVVRVVHGDVIGLPNIDPEIDWVATGYPDKVDVNQYVHVDVDHNLTGVNIYVQRIQGLGGSPVLSTVSGKILDLNNNPVTNAMVYASKGDKYYGYGITDSKGNYRMNVPMGDYIIVAHKVAHNSASMPVVIGENGMDNINFTMNKVSRDYPGQEIPEKFNLSQNYPNPFNPETVIKYSVSVSTNVTMKIYNTVGQEVATIVNEYHQPGNYEVSFNAANLTSGVYFYKITAGSFTDTKRMTLIK